MNTKKLIFGSLACLTLLVASATPYSAIEDNQEMGVEKKNVRIPGSK